VITTGADHDAGSNGSSVPSSSTITISLSIMVAVLRSRSPDKGKGLTCREPRSGRGVVRSAPPLVAPPQQAGGAAGRGREVPSAASTAAASSSLAPASTSITRSRAPLTSVRVTARCRRRTCVLDRQRRQLLAGRADLYGRVHLGTGSHPYSCHPPTTASSPVATCATSSGPPSRPAHASYRSRLPESEVLAWQLAARRSLGAGVSDVPQRVSLGWGPEPETSPPGRSSHGRACFLP
jgi:hypothetical protein